MARSVRAVSRRDSPFVRLLVLLDKEKVSADSLLPAMSKDNFVLVEGSAKKRTTLLPFKTGTFFTCLELISKNFSAVEKMCVISDKENWSISRMCLCGQRIKKFTWLCFFKVQNFINPTLKQKT
jgi:hypothetical protein